MSPPGRGTGTLAPLHAVRGDRPAIVDASGRQVILRGANLNSLGDYYQDDPSLPPTIPVTSHDWDEMAAQGFNVVRLIVSWSRLEPQRGQIDERYVRRIEAAVHDAAQRDIYTVIDMHQDAWGKYVASPPGVSCPPGEQPAIGWDGAPKWATLDAGADTCSGSSREDSDANRAAWTAFWADRDGIQTELVKVWSHLARAFAKTPSVAGFDLLNEPNAGDGGDLASQMAGYYRNAIAAIRDGERAGHGFAHPIFFEYSVSWQPVPAGFSADPNLVFAPHVYGGSIAPVSVDANWGYVDQQNRGYHTPIWVGEYGWFKDPVANSPKLRRFAQLEDQHLAGSTWWQWKQACGDPHTIGHPGGKPAPVVVQYHRIGCPGDHDLGIVPEWQTVVTRPYPRAAPGRLTSLTSDGAAATLQLAATGATPGGTLELWVPDRGKGAPAVGGQGIAGRRIRKVDGGYRVSADVCAPDYQASIGGSGSVPARCP